MPKKKIVAAKCRFDLVAEAHQNSMYKSKPQTQDYKNILNLETSDPDAAKLVYI